MNGNNGNGTQLCYLVVVVAAVVLLVWGFMDLLRRQLPHEKDTTDVISRQIRGFALIVLSQVVLILGAMLCVGFSGTLGDLSMAISRMAGNGRGATML